MMANSPTHWIAGSGLCAAFVPGYSGGTATELHRFPYSSPRTPSPGRHPCRPLIVSPRSGKSSRCWAPVKRNLLLLAGAAVNVPTDCCCRRSTRFRRSSVTRLHVSRKAATSHSLNRPRRPQKFLASLRSRRYPETSWRVPFSSLSRVHSARRRQQC